MHRYDPPQRIYAALFSSAFAIRKFVMRYLALPRPSFMRITAFTDQPDEHGRFYLTKWDAAPYYVKPTFWNRWGPVAWLTWALGKPVPGDAGDKYYPNGYDIPDIGPKYFEGKGRAQVEATMQELKIHRTGACPFH